MNGNGVAWHQSYLSISVDATAVVATNHVVPAVMKHIIGAANFVECEHAWYHRHCNG